jgi:putative membrane protein
MSERDFFEKKAKQRATAAIKTIESQTAAEVVVTLRHTSGNYRHVDYLFGFVISLVTLGVLLFSPVTFRLSAFPVDVTLAFVIGAVVCANVAPLRRALSSVRTRHANVRRAAREAFVDHGVSRCSGRWGVLVYVSMFERDVEVVPDLAIDPVSIEGWHDAVAAMRAAVQRTDFDAFVTAMEKLGPALAKPFPHRDDDVNELPDEIDDDEGESKESAKA